MNAGLLLQWAALTVSLFNTILLVWLGLTVLLTAERRTWGVGLVGGSLLLAGAFFVSHTAILGAAALGGSLEFWWRLGAFPVAALPLAWYATTLWYGGFWDDSGTVFHRRHRPGLALAAALAAACVGLLLVVNPLPGSGQTAGLLALAAGFPVYCLGCLGLSLEALLRPGPTARLMGDLARRRARPWLAATAGVLLGLSLAVAAALAWATFGAGARLPLPALIEQLVGVDALLAGLISVAVLLAGQAIVAYEVFTGKALPRGGLRRHWRYAILLAAGYGALVGGSLAVALRPVYSLLLTTLLMTLFYALFSWRAYAEREQAMRQLRPFVAGPHLVDRLLQPNGAAAALDVDAATPFWALCETVLGARWACLAAAGPLAPLTGPPLVHGAGPAPAELPAGLNSPETTALALTPGQYGPAHWAVPLWSERGLIGVLWLGAKAGGGPYTQEEIEIARATGERLLDSRASAELARRLMALQRERLAESRVLDRRAQRLIHDEVLPELHAALLQLDSTAGEPARLLTSAHKRLAGLLRAAPPPPVSDLAQAGLPAALRGLFEGEFAGAFDSTTWDADPAAEQAAAGLPPVAAEVLFYAAREAVRNAARYGRRPEETAPLHLRLAVRLDNGLQVMIEDDGAGIMPGQPAREAGGYGLALHQAMLAVLGGALAVESEPGRFTRVRLTLPVMSRR